jgi:hypothetical protein
VQAKIAFQKTGDGFIIGLNFKKNHKLFTLKLFRFRKKDLPKKYGEGNANNR